MNSSQFGPSAHPAMQKFLARLLHRSTLGEEEQQALFRLTYRAIQVRAHTDIISPGQMVSHATLIAKGLVARVDQMRDGKRQIVAFHLAGDMCDLQSVVAPTAAWGMSAMAAGTVLEIPHAQLRELAAGYPQIARSFWREAVVDASILAKWLGNLGRQDSRARLAHLLCEMGVRAELVGIGTRTCFALETTQEQLADALGLTAVHVNRTMQVLRQEGLIATRSHTVQVADWDRLADAAEFDPAYLLLDEPSRLIPGDAQRTTQRASFQARELPRSTTRA